MYEMYKIEFIKVTKLEKIKCMIIFMIVNSAKKVTEYEGKKCVIIKKNSSK